MITYADSVTPSFGIPFPTDKLSVDRGQLKLKLTEREIMELPEQELMDLNALLDRQPDLSRQYPLDWGWTLPTWEKCNQLWPKAKCQVIFGGNRSTKTSYAAALIHDIMRKIPEAMTYSLQTNEERSNEINQALVHSYLDMEKREADKQKGKKFSYDYNEKNGFSGDVLILPPNPGEEKSKKCKFKNYSQYHNNVQAFEGLKGHLIHADEEIPFKLFDTLFARLGDYHGRILLTFTTLQGYTPVVTDLLKQAETLESRWCEALGMELPTLQKCSTWPDTYIHYWWTEDNPFIDAQEIVRSYANRPLNDKKARLYGIPTKSSSNQFPKFSREANVIPHEEVPFIKDPRKKRAVYLGSDPGGTKPWFIVYGGYTPDGNLYIYKEFPDISFGEWAVPHQNAMGQPIGKPGPAQKPLGWGYESWKTHIEDMDDGEDVVMRWMDPYFCNQGRTTKDGQTTTMDEMAAVGMYFTPATAEGVGVGAGVARINELLEWDDTKPISENNCPKLYISDRCENLIQAMQEYTGVSKAEHWKDPVDALRYIVVSDSGYNEGGYAETYGGGSY